MVSKHVPVIALVLASAACVFAGLNQSPIDIRSEEARIVTDLEPLQYKHYGSKRSTYYLANSGHGAQITTKNLHPARLWGGPLGTKTFALEQAHFHWGLEDGVGSEHFLDGEASSMEVHLVHWNMEWGTFEEAAKQPNGLAVVALFIEGLDNIKYNPDFQHVVKLIPQIKNKKGDKVESPNDLLAWVRPYLEAGGYFTYAGSLTTEPYTENVRWIVYDNPILISRAQIEAFRQIKNEHHEPLRSNRRELQPIAGREILYVPVAE